MQDQVNATPAPTKRVPWNKGKVTGAKPPLRPKHVWSIRTKLEGTRRRNRKGSLRHPAPSDLPSAMSGLRRRSIPG